jgi:hypothetical protein
LSSSQMFLMALPKTSLSEAQPYFHDRHDISGCWDTGWRQGSKAVGVAGLESMIEAILATDSSIRVILEVSFLAVWSDSPVILWPRTRIATDCLGGSRSKVSVWHTVKQKISACRNFASGRSSRKFYVAKIIPFIVGCGRM